MRDPLLPRNLGGRESALTTYFCTKSYKAHDLIIGKRDETGKSAGQDRTKVSEGDIGESHRALVTWRALELR